MQGVERSPEANDLLGKMLVTKVITELREIAVRYRKVKVAWCTAKARTIEDTIQALEEDVLGD